MGFTIPIRLGCNAAFAGNHGRSLRSLERLCEESALAPKVTYLVLIGCGIVLVIVASILKVRRRRAATRQRGMAFGPERAVTYRDQGQGSAPRTATGPNWPFILGPLIIGAGIIMGYTVPVGRRCSGAFAGDHPEASGYDIAQAMQNGLRTYAADACAAAAPAQAGIYWGIVGFGIAVVILGAVLRALAKQQPVAAPASVADELTGLARLRDQGLLTTEEFEAQKRKVLQR